MCITLKGFLDDVAVVFSNWVNPLGGEPQRGWQSCSHSTGEAEMLVKAL